MSARLRRFARTCWQRATSALTLEQMEVMQPASARSQSAMVERVWSALQQHNLAAPIRDRLLTLLEVGGARRVANQ